MSVAPHCADPVAFEDWLRVRLTGGRADGDEGDARLGRPSWGRGVRLATVHRVKGLEWPHVIVLSATEGLMPHRLAGDLEEERRVFHVAITRGSESVLIVADGPKSPFITEMSWRSKLEPAGLPKADRARPPRHAPAEAAAPGPAAGRKAQSRLSESPPIDEAAEPEAAVMFQRLRQWRWEQSQEEEVRPFRVFSDAVLRELARRRPTNDEALVAVPGIGPAKLAAYGGTLKSILAGIVQDQGDGREESSLTTGGAVMSSLSEIIFEVSEDEADGGYSASAVGYGIHTEGETVDEVRRNVREAVECYFDDGTARPGRIRLHFVRDEVLTL